MSHLLQDINKTLFLPLWGRAKLTSAGNPVLNDPKAVELVEQFPDLDFTVQEKIFIDIFNVGWVIRAAAFDDTVRAFTARHPDAAIVNIGAGLDTGFFRVDNGALTWYDLDLPEVIALRKRFLPEGPRNRCLPASLFDAGWMRTVAERHPHVLLMAGGVLFYFPESQLRPWFNQMADTFPGAELIFDAVSVAAMPMVNKGLSMAGMQSAMLQWGLETPAHLCEWDARIEILDAYPTFSRQPDRSFWPPAVQEHMDRSDAGNNTSIVHIRFGK